MTSAVVYSLVATANNYNQYLYRETYSINTHTQAQNNLRNWLVAVTLGKTTVHTYQAEYEHFFVSYF